MNARSDPRLVKRLSVFALATTVFSVVVGLSGLAGWKLHIVALTTWGAAPTMMVANTAACFALVGGSLWLLRKKENQSIAWARNLAAKIAAATAGLVGLLSLAERIFTLDLGIDRFLLVAPLAMQTATVRPDLMSPVTAAAFLLLALALLAIDWRTRRGHYPAQFFSLAAGGCGSFSVLSFAFDPHIYAAHLSLALPTAVTFSVFSLGLVCARTEWGLGALLCSRSLGGSMARRLLPAALIPVAVGWLRWQITASGFCSEWSIVVLVSLTTMSLLAGLIAWAAVAVDRNDKERRKVEEVRERLAAIVESSDDAIVSKTLDGTIAAWNRGAEKVFGYPSSEAVGKPLRILIPPERGNEEPDILAKIGRGESVEHFETVRVRKDGRTIDVSLTISPIKDSSGAIVGASTIARDITERKQAEEDLARKAEELARSNAELEQFAYIASHDLQEPLRMVAAYTQLLAERYRGQLDENADKFIGYACEGALRMQALIHDLLAFSRVGRSGEACGRVDCDAAMEEVLLSLGPAIKESGAVVTYAALPVVWADRTQMAQVFQNLIGNAIKFRGKDPPVISVQAEKAGREWLFRVSDNGIGIAPEYAQNIFVVFQRLHTRTEYPGNGIGLAICKKIIEHWGGKIWVEAQAGAGSIFQFTMPCEDPAEALCGKTHENIKSS